MLLYFRYGVDQVMKRVIFTTLAFLLVNVTSIFGKGVLAGTEISNFATLQYEMDGVSYTTDSNTITDKVDQVIDVSVVWQDAAPVDVSIGEKNRVLTFKVTNTGNGKDTFDLTLESNSTCPFGIENPRIFMDTNSNGIFDISTDQIVSSITLEADNFSTIFLVADMPTSSFPCEIIFSNTIAAKSNIGGSGVPGTTFPGAGTDGVFAVDGMSGGVDRAIGKYQTKDEISVKLTLSSTLPVKMNCRLVQFCAIISMYNFKESEV